jgi:hypothetical protein
MFRRLELAVVPFITLTLTLGSAVLLCLGVALEYVR